MFCLHQCLWPRYGRGNYGWINLAEKLANALDM
jgi:hypothetical protein